MAPFFSRKNKDTPEYFKESSEKLLTQYLEALNLEEKQQRRKKDNNDDLDNDPNYDSSIIASKRTFIQSMLTEISQVSDTDKDTIVGILGRGVKEISSAIEQRNRQRMNETYTVVTSRYDISLGSDVPVSSRTVQKNQLRDDPWPKKLNDHAQKLTRIHINHEHEIQQAVQKTIDQLDKYCAIKTKDWLRGKRQQMFIDNNYLTTLKGARNDPTEFIRILKEIEGKNNVLTSGGKEEWGYKYDADTRSGKYSSYQTPVRKGSGRLSGILDAQIKNLNKLTGSPSESPLKKSLT